MMNAHRKTYLWAVRHVCTMPVVNFRIDEALKEKMDRLKHLNWSELLRKYVKKVVMEEESRLGEGKNRVRILGASRDIDELRQRTPRDWKGAEVVIRWRKLRR